MASTLPPLLPDDPDSASRLYALLSRGPIRSNRLAGLADLRRIILEDGVPSGPDGSSKLRIYTWLILLNAAPLSTDRYLDLVRQGPSPAYDKIRLDTPRTLTTDPLFRRKVTENALVRVLNGIALRLNEQHEADLNGWRRPGTAAAAAAAAVSPGQPRTPADVSTVITDDQSVGSAPTPTAHAHAHAHWLRDARSPSPSAAGSSSRRGSASSQRNSNTVGYVQGMNVLAAPLLYAAHSEAQAFQALHALLTTHVPAYILPTMEGVHRGLALVDAILALSDPALAAHLQAHGLGAKIWGFASVLTLCACTPPLTEVLRLWDFLLAYGCHMNLLCIVAQVILCRDSLLGSKRPNMVLRTLPPLRAREIVEVVMRHVLPRLGGELFESIVLHARV